MITSSILFYLIFAIPMVLLFIWILKQDRKQQKLGFFILFLILAFALYVILTKVPSYQELIQGL